MKNNLWTTETLKNVTCNFDILHDDANKIKNFLDVMNDRFPPSVFDEQLDMRRAAIENTERAKKILDGARQKFPDVKNYNTLNIDPKKLKGCAVVFTAGGEGERLRVSLEERGVAQSDLQDFTKATYPLTGANGRGALHLNLIMIADICNKYKIDIPVIVTTGPANSTTARVIPQIINDNKNFGVANIKIVAQDERLHFTQDEKIAIDPTSETPYPITQPDETGGPIMKLKQPDDNGESPLDWLASLGCKKILIIQGTNIYDPKILLYMAAASANHDCVGGGIARKTFAQNDPFGTFVTIEDKTRICKTCIIEQDVRNDDTREIVNKDGDFLPFNTGLYALDCDLLLQNELPHFATPPKIVLQNLPKSQKVGYAATDLLPLAKNPSVLTVDQNMFAAVKTVDDIETAFYKLNAQVS